MVESDEINWPGLGDSPDRGRRIAALLFGAPLWVHRRVDSISLGATGTTRRAISFDFTLPSDLAAPGSDGRVLVPLALIEKGALRRVSATGPADHPMPVLGRDDNTQLAVEMLVQITSPGMPRPTEESEQMRDLIHRVVGFNPAEASAEARRAIEDEVEGQLMPWSGIPDPESRAVVARMVKGFLDQCLLVVEVEEELVGKRTVVKFSYDRSLPIPDLGNRVGIIEFDLPDAGLAHSQHVEFSAPAGLVVRRLSVQETAGDEYVAGPREDVPAKPRSTAHVAFAPSETYSGAEVSVELVPAASGVFTFTVAGVLVVLLFAVAVAAEKFFGAPILSPRFTVPSQAVSLLLVGPALFLSWMARAPEHRALAVMLLPLRLMLIACAGVLLTAGIGVGVPLEPWWWNLLWLVVVLVAMANLLGLVLYLVNARRMFRSLWKWARSQ
ncbi:hypothetical protein [Sinomonas flava]|uniref:hypothetical protein n=1 Tax=Sinomonas flava TaxID=496857 RepID=UPI0039A7335E